MSSATFNITQIKEKSQGSPRSNTTMAGQNNAYKTLRKTCENSKLESPKLSVQYRSLLDQHKSVFFGILKRLLREPHTLQEGMWHEEEKNGSVFRLIYGRKVCKVIWEPQGIEHDMVVAALDIYLQWRGNHIEELTLKNLYTVQNELKILRVQDEKTLACFSVAKQRFIQKPPNIQYTITLSISDETVLTFGHGHKVMTVMYDEKENNAVYYIQ